MPNLFPPDKQKSLRSRSLDLLRFPLAIVVVLIHVVASHRFYLDGHAVNVKQMQGAQTFFNIIDTFLRNQSVPVYYFIAGYVFFLGITLTMETYGHKLMNRAHSLLIPYISWNLLAILSSLIMFIPALGLYFPYLSSYKFDFSATAFLESFWNSWYGIISRTETFPPGGGIYPQDYPLWFVRDLMLTVLAAPMIYWVLRHTRWYAVLALGATWLLVAPLKTGHPGQLLTALFFFSWGAYMSYHKRDMIKDFRHFFLLSLALYILLGCVCLILGKQHPIAFSYIKHVNIIVGMIMAYGLASWLIEHCGVKVSSFLASASFFVYAGHGLFVAYFNILYFNLIRPKHFSGVTLVYALTLVSVILLLLFLYWFFGKYCRRLQRFLGGRNYPA